MIEAILSWACLIGALVSDEPLGFIASGVFAVAGQLSRIVDRMDGKKCPKN